MGIQRARRTGSRTMGTYRVSLYLCVRAYASVRVRADAAPRSRAPLSRQQEEKNGDMEEAVSREASPHIAQCLGVSSWILRSSKLYSCPPHILASQLRSFLAAPRA